MSDDLMNGLLAYPSILVKQRPKDLCLQLCCGYEPVVQFEIYNPQQGNTSKKKFFNLIFFFNFFLFFLFFFQRNFTGQRRI